jgi:hypothetical protein
MPSNPAINPFNYNIDNFDSGILGPISDTNFRTYLFTHNLPVANSVINGILGGNPWQDRGTEYDVSQSSPNIVDVPNLQDVAQTPSLYNNLTNPRQVNLTNNLQNLNPEVQNTLGLSTPIQAGLGQDATTLFNTNTANIDLPSPEDISDTPSVYNNFTSPRQDSFDKNPTFVELATWYPSLIPAINQAGSSKNTSYGVPQTLKIGFAGNVESWVSPGGAVSTVSELRDTQLFSPANNKWGPNEMISYSYKVDEVVNPNTGLIQYSTAVQGDFRDQLLTRSLGVGVIPFSTIGSGINFKPDGQNISELDKIARKQRGVELLNRIKLNFTDNTVGALNTSPFNLLAGGNLIEQNYSITVPKTGLGKAAQFAADLAGFNLPTSIIPTDEVGNLFGLYNIDNTSPDITGILDYTGSGQKSLLYNALYINKYGPTLNANPPTTSLGQITKEKLGAGQAPNTQNYLTQTSTTTENTGQRKDSLINDINQKVKNVLNKSKENAESLRSSVFDDTSAAEWGSDKYGSFYGRYEPLESVGFDLADGAGFNEGGGELNYSDKDVILTTYNGTPVEQGRDITIGVTDERFDWRSKNNNQFKKGLLKYTQELVNKSNLGSAAGYIGYFDSDGNTGALVNGAHQTGVKSPKSKPTNPSKGNVARNYNFTDNSGGEYYCRSWSSRRKYHTWDNLVRSDGNWWRKQSTNTDMTMNWGYDKTTGRPLGTPKIAWDKNDFERVKNIVNGSKIKSAVIPYMLSIENLAWKDAPQHNSLPECEKGPNGGRIMWFPPYDINFTDSSSVSWDTTSFIGRGENLYTYNHTERSGTLDFSIVVDHPAALNQLKDRFKNSIMDEAYNSFFAGCDNETLKQIFGDLLEDGEDVIIEEYTEPEINITSTDPENPPFNNIKIYFENARRVPDNTSIKERRQLIGRKVDLDKYEVTVPSLVNVNENQWLINSTEYPCGPAGTNSYPYLNKGTKENLEKLARFLTCTGEFKGKEDGKNFKIKVLGYTSPALPSDNYNKTLASDRAINTRDYLLKLMLNYEKNDKPEVYLHGNKDYGTYPTEEELKGSPLRWFEPIAEPNGKKLKRECQPSDKCLDNSGKPSCCDGNPCDTELKSGSANSKADKQSRFSEIILIKDTELQVSLLKKQIDKEKKIQKERIKQINKERQELANRSADRFITECEYFEQMKRDQPFVYQSLSEKIKYFHPAFHAITPEGFNSRLTFLLQCTRQGPQMMDSEIPSNMVFGRPPVCVLRIGDFYYTKIIIDSVNITYEPLQWDLNPEGIGVQPMIAKVSLGFKFIGGSSLGGPIKQLQNAVSYNFFANTGTYQKAKQLSDETGKRLKLVYGAFLKPSDIDTIFSENDVNLLKAEEKSKEDNKNTANTTALGTETNPIILPEIDITTNTPVNTPTSEVKSTEGDNRPPTPPQPPNGGDDVIIRLLNKDGVEYSNNPNPVSNTFYGVAGSDPNFTLESASQILVNVKKPNGRYYVLQIFDKRKECCADFNPGHLKEPIGPLGIKITPSTGTKVTQKLSGNLQECPKCDVVSSTGTFTKGQITTSISIPYYATPLDPNNNVLSSTNDKYWSGEGVFDIEITYNPGLSPVTNQQQEVILRTQITLPKT